jgi:hypothetical protein
MNTLPAELICAIGAHLGAHEHGTLERARLAYALCDRNMPILPIDDGKCIVRLDEMASLSRELSNMSMRVYDAAANHIVPIASRHLVLSRKEHKTARLYPPALGIVWTPGNNVWLMHPYGSPLVDVRDSMTPKEVNRATLKDERASVKGRRNERTPDNKESNVQALLSVVGRELDRFEHLAICGWKEMQAKIYPTEVLAALRLSKLQHLSFSNVNLTTHAIQMLASETPASLSCMEISGTTELSNNNSTSARVAVVALADLMQRWRSISTETIRKLALDDSKVPFLAELLHGFADPGYNTLDFVSENSMISPQQVYLSVDGRTRKEWIESLKDAPYIQLFPKVTLKPTLKQATSKCSKKQKVDAEDAKNAFKKTMIAKSHERNEMHTLYTNPNRELMRYMWQKTDYKCKNCSFVWPKHSVTVSWRETCVSMCLKGKKTCQSRPESTRASAGELWITNRHVPGNGGTDLTPEPEKVISCEENNEIVGIDPNTRDYVTFPRWYSQM